MIAVISDVHGNLPALEAVLDAIEKRGIERIWCLGDTVGYGPFACECVDLVRERCDVVLAGNHDLIARGDISLDAFRSAGSGRGSMTGPEAGIVHAQRVLSAEQMQWLNTLSPTALLTDQGAELYHASAREPIWEYVIDQRVAAAHLAIQRLPLSLVGHSHHQLLYRATADGASGGAVPGGLEPIQPGEKLVANPGSVGQPRDGDPRAGVAILGEHGIDFIRVEYDIPRMREAVSAAGLPDQTGDRLLAGR